jgi:hypothetical protein
MGTDIHGVFQAYDAALREWLDVESDYEQGRHYQLFAVLAGVRNGIGFAGVKTGEPVRPIAQPRGLPPGFVMDGEDHPISDVAYMEPWRRKNHQAGEGLAIWMGDHSHSWLEGDEMLRWYADAPGVIKTGVLARSVYEAWSGTGNPTSWAGAVWGPSVVTINDNAAERAATPDWTHIACEWDVSLREELAHFFEEVERLVKKHGRIRFVFGFDS